MYYKAQWLQLTTLHGIIKIAERVDFMLNFLAKIKQKDNNNKGENFRR